MSKELKKSLVNGLIWTSGGQLLTVLANLTINVILARYLGPNDFGLMGIVMFFIMIGEVLTKGGLSGALIRQKEIEPIDYSTVFVFNLSVSLILYILLLTSSNYIAASYEDPQLSGLLQIGGLSMVINSFQLINITRLIRHWQFKKRFIYQFSSTVLSGIVAITLAATGFGVKSLIALPLANSIFLTGILLIKEGFHGRLQFSKQSFIKSYSFGINTSIASLLETAFENIYSLLLGKFFTLSQVGFYYQAQKLQKIPNNVLNSFSQRVLFPVLAKKQDDLRSFNLIYQNIITIFTVLVGLLGLLFYIYSESIILLLLGKSWIGVIFYLKLLIIASFFYMQEQFNRVIFKVFDQTRSILLLEVIKKCFQAATIAFGIFHNNLEYLIYGFVATNIFSFFINFYSSRQITKTLWVKEISMVLKTFSCGIVTFLVFNSLFQHLSINPYFKLLFSPVVIVFYIALIQLFRVLHLKDLIKTLQSLPLKKV